MNLKITIALFAFQTVTLNCTDTEQFQLARNFYGPSTSSQAILRFQQWADNDKLSQVLTTDRWRSDLSQVGVAIAGAARNESLTKFVSTGVAMGSLVTNASLIGASPAVLQSLGMTAFTPYVGVAVAFCALASSLMADEGGGDSGLGEALNALSQQIARGFELVLGAIDELKEQSYQQHREEMLALAKIFKSQFKTRAEMRRGHAMLSAQLEHLHGCAIGMEKAATSRHSEIMGSFTAMSTEQFRKILSGVGFNFARRATTNSATLVNDIHRLYDEATITATGNNVTGSSVNLRLSKSIQEELPEDFDDANACKNINLVRKLEQALDPSLIDAGDVANPDMLMKCIRAAAYMLNAAPSLTFANDDDKREAAVDLQQIITTAENTLNVTERIAQPQVMQKLVINYSTSIESLQAKVDAQMQAFVGDETLKQVMIARLRHATQKDIEAITNMPAIKFQLVHDAISIMDKVEHVNIYERFDRFTRSDKTPLVLEIKQAGAHSYYLEKELNEKSISRRKESIKQLLEFEKQRQQNINVSTQPLSHLIHPAEKYEDHKELSAFNFVFCTQFA